MILDQTWIVQAVVILVVPIVWCPILDVDSLRPPDGTDGTQPPQEDGQRAKPSPTTSRTNKFDFNGDAALTHPGWVQLDQRSYKIYNDLLSYDGAMQRCINHHPDAQLAVVASFNHSQILGRYLLSGQPKLANAWIGARWHSDGYQFEPEPIMLPNASDSTGYPPWKYLKTQKSGSCVLLDRHLANITVFLEANCGRIRPYICYMQNNTGFTDLIRGDRAYRLHHAKRNWRDARNYCRGVYANYSGRLAEIREPVQLYDLLYLMRQKESDVLRVWLGGIFDKSASAPAWLWDSNHEVIPVGSKTRMKWVHNSLYESPHQNEDSCVAMDSSEMNYGMACKFEQSYVCQFSVKSLTELQAEEKKKQIHSKGSSKLEEQLQKHESHLYTARSRGPSDYIGGGKGVESPWIQADQKLYKAFSEHVSYDSAKEKCLSLHPDVELAVVPSINHAHILGRHIVKSRPILKAAWIGARWIVDTYQFEPEPIKLASTSDTTGYPPWSSNKMHIRGCIALDRQASDGPLFVESHCQHRRPYICYTENGTGFTDLIVGDHGYRLHHNKRKWGDANDYCTGVYATHSAHLVEITEAIHKYHLSQLMEKHGRATRHVWLGGRLYRMGAQPSWFWDNSCEEISMGSDSHLTWDNSTVYLSSMDDDCVAMDVFGKSYGAACEYELNYVCQFSAEALRLLQRQEESRMM